MNKKEMISLVIASVLLFAGCNKEQKDTKNTNNIEVNTSDDKPLTLPF